MEYGFSVFLEPYWGTYTGGRGGGGGGGPFLKIDDKTCIKKFQKEGTNLIYLGSIHKTSQSKHQTKTRLNTHTYLDSLYE